jgi:hypothetical protein
MSIPDDHHFLPRFYLSAWASSGKLVEYSRPHELVVHTARAPKGTGKAKGLYSLTAETDPLMREQVELRIMKKIDDDAAPVFRKLHEKRVNEISSEERSAWATFLMSMIFRTPARLEMINEQIRSTDYEWTDQELEEYAATRSPDDPISPDEFLKAGTDDEISTTKLLLMTRMCGSPVIGQGLVDMRWGVIDLSSADHGLLTSDEPIITSNGLDKGDSFVMLPLGPTKLFIAGSTKRALWSFSSQSPRRLEGAINDCIVAQAHKIVIGHHDRHLTFVERRLGKSPVSGEGLLGRHTWTCP